ncbi:DUF975 family protein [Candidatus Omnitrophota bacterium]
MSEKRFDMGEAIRFGWNTMKANFWFFVGILLVVWVVQAIPEIISKVWEENLILSLILQFVSMVIGLLVGLGLIKIALTFIRNEKPLFSDLFSCTNLLINYIAATMLYSLMVVGGLILLIVPGIILGIKFQFYSYFIVEKNCGPIEALKMSAAITKGVKLDLFVLSLTLIGINLLGMLALVVGLFATFPATMIAFAYVYRKLAGSLEGVESPGAGTAPTA